MSQSHKDRRKKKKNNFLEDPDDPSLVNLLETPSYKIIHEAQKREFLSRTTKGPEIRSLQTVFGKIITRHQAHFALSFSRKGECRLQVHANPTLTWYGSLEEVLHLAAV